MKRLLTLILIITTLPLYGQYTLDWKQTYGGIGYQEINDINETKDRGFIITGYTTTMDKKRYLWVAKIDEFGELVWENYYDKYFLSIGNAVIETMQGNYVAVGYATDKKTFNKEAWVLKLNPKGEIIWEKRIGRRNEENAVDVLQQADGGFAMLGYTNTNKSGTYDIWLVKLTGQGTRQWEKVFGGKEDEKPGAICKATNMGFGVAGYTASPSKMKGQAERQIMLLRLDAYGNKQWEQTYANSTNDMASGVSMAKDEGFVISGLTRRDEATNYDIMVIRTDPYGNRLWKKIMGGNYWDEATDVDYTYDDGCVVSGFTRNKNSDFSNFWLLKLDNKGNELWNKIYRRKSLDFANAIAETYDRGFIVAGATFKESETGWEGAVLKFANNDRPNFLFKQPAREETMTASPVYHVKFTVRTPARLDEMRIFINDSLLTDDMIAEDIPYDSTHTEQIVDRDKFFRDPYLNRNIILRTIISEDTTANLQQNFREEDKLERKMYLVDFNIPVKMPEKRNKVVVKARNRYGVRYSKERYINIVDLPAFRW